jgi:hypothetical protein
VLTGQVPHRVDLSYKGDKKMAYTEVGVRRTLRNLEVSAADITLFLELLGAREDVPKNLVQLLRRISHQEWQAIGNAKVTDKPALMQTAINTAIAPRPAPAKRKAKGGWSC